MAEKLGNIGETFVQIKADMRELDKEVKDLKTKMDREGEKIGSSFSKGLKKAFLAGGAIIALKKALDFTKEAKDLAKNAEEIGNKFNTVFESIADKANNVADAFAEKFNLAGSTVRELLGNTGDLLVGFGFTEEKALELSESVNSLAQDLTSFTNFAGGAKGASEALTKALLGETESAKSLGIVIRQDTKEFKSQVEMLSMTEGMTLQQAKAVTILGEAYKQSGKAVGDYARTKDSLANKERALDEQFKETMETLGKDLIPIFDVAIQVVSDFTKQSAGANEQISLFGIIAKSIGTVLLGVISGLKLVGGFLGTIGASVYAFASGDFSLASTIIKNGFSDIQEDALKAGEQFSTIWSKSEKSFTSSANKINSALNLMGGGGGQGSEKRLKLLEAEAELYEELYLGTEKWYNKSIELIKAQTEKMISSGIDKADAIEWEKKKLNELLELYDRLNTKISDIKPFTPGFRKPKATKPVEQGENPYTPDDETLDLMNSFYQAQRESLFSWADAVVTAADMARGAMAGFFDDIYLKGEWANSMLEKAFVGMANAFISQVQRMLSEWLAFQAIKVGLNLIPGGGSILSALTNIPGRATGGPVEPGKIYKVNENTPNSEYFMPTVPGTVIPNNMVESISNSNNAGVVSAINGLYGRMEAVTMQLIDMELSDRFKKIKIEGMETFVSNRGIHQTAKKGEKIYDRSR